MSLRLLIDCSCENANIHLCNKSELLSSSYNIAVKDHAAWIHGAIKEILSFNGRKIEELEAIGVAEGPGSYTGLRVAMATAKGICYAREIPLILVNTLKLIAASYRMNCEKENKVVGIIVPMIDARRMEVYAAAYDQNLTEVMNTQAIVLNQNSFDHLNVEYVLVFIGNGAVKWRNLAGEQYNYCEDIEVNGEAFASLVDAKIEQGELSDLAYSEPFYLKEFYTAKS
jgi:tRNA threonylcarbamoyladenosine biosynthesis protein TsaB